MDNPYGGMSPRGVFEISGGSMRPVRRNLWRYFCSADQANLVLNAVLKVIPSAKMADETSKQPLEFIFTEDTTPLWFVIRAIVDDGAGSVLQVNENAGDLFVRMTVPLVPIDNGGSGGPNIHGDQIETDLIQLTWGK